MATTNRWSRKVTETSNALDLKHGVFTKSPREIAGELGANYLLTGTVRWERSDSGSGRVRVSPVLLRASDQSSVWAEPYEGPLSDVFRVQANRFDHEIEFALLHPGQ